MAETRPGRVTELLAASVRGDPERTAELTDLVYEELKRLARRHMGGERAGHTLGATGLVHEAFLRLVGQQEARYANRAQFFAVASLTMRRILVNWAREKTRKKRGGGAPELPLDEERDAWRDLDAEEVLGVNTALDRMAGLSERAVRVVECRYFGGLTVEETAEALEISPATVKREWTLARSWLRRELTR